VKRDATLTARVCCDAVCKFELVCWVRTKTVEWVVYMVERTWPGIRTTREGTTYYIGRLVEAVKSLRDFP